MTSRDISPADISIANATGIKDFKSQIDENVNPDVDKAPKLSTNKIFEFFDEFTEFLQEHVGSVSKRPLGYVVRTNAMVKPTNDDPAFGEADSTYPTYHEEIYFRAPIKTVDANGQITSTNDRHFNMDNQAVFKLVWDTVKGGDYVTHIKPFQRAKDGREAFKALYRALLGRDAVNNYIARAENKLSTLSLDGSKRKNWNFDKYVLAHKAQHNVMEKCQSLGLYRGIDEQSKIRQFHRGISDPKLDTVKASDSSNPKATFDGVVESYRSYMERHKENTKEVKHTLTIAAVSQQSGNRGRDDTKKTGENADGFDPDKDYSKFKIAQRYYKAAEWNKLSKGQRNYLRTVSKARRSKSRTKGNDDAVRGLQLLSTLFENRQIHSMGSKGGKRKEDEVISDTSDTSDDERKPAAKKRTRVSTKTKK
jgi:hypothetical protein